MTDKNGIDIKTGNIVEITGAFFKNDNGLYFVSASPDDPYWSGKDHCLHKISKSGKISKAKYNTCFWPISTFVNDRIKNAQAKKWNAEHAAIEVKAPCKDMSEVFSYFREKAENLDPQIKRDTVLWGADAEHVKKAVEAKCFYQSVAESAS